MFGYYEDYSKITKSMRMRAVVWFVKVISPYQILAVDDSV